LTLPLPNPRDGRYTFLDKGVAKRQDRGTGQIQLLSDGLVGNTFVCKQQKPTTQRDLLRCIAVANQGVEL
jgi:hypothetical protein